MTDEQQTMINRAEQGIIIDSTSLSFPEGNPGRLGATEYNMLHQRAVDLWRVLNSNPEKSRLLTPAQRLDISTRNLYGLKQLKTALEAMRDLLDEDATEGGPLANSVNNLSSLKKGLARIEILIQASNVDIDLAFAQLDDQLAFVHQISRKTATERMNGVEGKVQQRLFDRLANIARYRFATFAVALSFILTAGVVTEPARAQAQPVDSITDEGTAPFAEALRGVATRFADQFKAAQANFDEALENLRSAPEDLAYLLNLQLNSARNVFSEASREITDSPIVERMGQLQWQDKLSAAFLGLDITSYSSRGLINVESNADLSEKKLETINLFEQNELSQSQSELNQNVLIEANRTPGSTYELQQYGISTETLQSWESKLGFAISSEGIAIKTNPVITEDGNFDMSQEGFIPFDPSSEFGKDVIGKLYLLQQIRNWGGEATFTIYVRPLENRNSALAATALEVSTPFSVNAIDPQGAPLTLTYTANSLILSDLPIREYFIPPQLEGTGFNPLPSVQLVESRFLSELSQSDPNLALPAEGSLVVVLRDQNTNKLLGILLNGSYRSLLQAEASSGTLINYRSTPNASNQENILGQNNNFELITEDTADLDSLNELPRASEEGQLGWYFKDGKVTFRDESGFDWYQVQTENGKAWIRGDVANVGSIEVSEINPTATPFPAFELVDSTPIPGSGEGIQVASAELVNSFAENIGSFERSNTTFYNTENGDIIGQYRFDPTGVFRYEIVNGILIDKNPFRTQVEQSYPGGNPELLFQRYGDQISGWDQEQKAYRFNDGSLFYPGIGTESTNPGNFAEDDLKDGRLNPGLDWHTADFIPGQSGMRLQIQISSEHPYYSRINSDPRATEVVQDAILKILINRYPTLAGRTIIYQITADNVTGDINYTRHDGVDAFVYLSYAVGVTKYDDGTVFARVSAPYNRLNRDRSNIEFGIDLIFSLYAAVDKITQNAERGFEQTDAAGFSEELVQAMFETTGIETGFPPFLPVSK